jgi:hypothetical protein
MNRRQFLGGACGALAGMLFPAGAALPGIATASADERRRKLIIVVFGGGTRYSESIGDPEHRYVPRLWSEMVPRGTLFTDVRVEGRVVHTNCTASILTGHREYDADNDWSRPVEYPTVFEIVRKSRAAPDTAAWAFVYASILSNVGQSGAAGFGSAYAANVVEPPTIPRATAERIGARLQEAAATGSVEEELTAAREAACWTRADSHIRRSGLRSETARQFLDQQYQEWKSSSGTTSHDAFLTDRAIACLEQFAPDVITLAYGEIDCAHYGSWSRYVEAIQRTDRLTWRLWQAAEKLEGYRGQTLMLILPDHGRELEAVGGTGYLHHSNFYTRENEDEGCRRVWMLVLGPGIAPGRKVEKPVPQTATAATALEYLGLDPSPRAAGSLLAMAR